LAPNCEAIQETLAEICGETERLSEEERRHLDHCPRCSEVAAAENALGLIFAKALPPFDPHIEEGVRAAMRSSRRRRRIMALLPVAASLLVALLGVVMLGGLPGGSLLALLPVWSSQGWMSLAAAVGDWATVFNTAAGAASELLGPGMLAASLVVSVLGFGVVVVAARRWRQVSPWRNSG
jgi:predicted anti-sigma-YlaC factor YlaD